MANYNYDESGNMAAYFLLTFLCIILIPLSLSALPSRKSPSTPGCQCNLCIQQRENIRKREGGSILGPRLKRKTIIVIVGWSLVAFLAHKLATTTVINKIYDPFEILGLRSGVSLKEIKSHYKKLSRTFHPDKVKLGVNQTMESVEAKFVEITKAYKSLTDETIRKNWELYGHPDGRQEVSMGIALPKWIVESGNNIWVLGAYGAIFGGALPALVGRWWFGNRQKTKDGVNARSAAAFFKNLSEESGIDDVVGTLGKTFEWEWPFVESAKDDSELLDLENKIKQKLHGKWDVLKKLAEADEHEHRHRAFVLLYAHLLRLPVASSSLRKEQEQVLLQTPTLLNSLLNISVSRNWLHPTLAVMRLHAYLAQALPPGQDQLKLAQLPCISADEAIQLTSRANGVKDVISTLEAKGDERVENVKKAVERWGSVEVVGASFRVIGERFVTPSSIVYLVAKLRLSPPSAEMPVYEPVQETRTPDAKEEEFLAGKKDAEDLPQGDLGNGWAHAPYWPANRKPAWWIVLADVKLGKVVVPPLRVTDIPVADPEHGQYYRSFKIQFQAPPAVGMFTWRLYVVSDTFVGEEAWRDMVLKIDDPAVLNVEEPVDDEISEPEEDSLAGQMAMMRGGLVKRRQDEESDEESSTDDEDHGEKSDSSDSD
ncbi:Translocation protein [Sparassis crispa]|uniref:Translocation protein n=1 Tax=Sparassis crispa TaxID=139825 RepID=A0A401GA14_9APHY|nr:Translocation protein [Sparassis crispa]GBE78987.1 Translocation protein [Sparassis crispa]